MTQNLEEQLLRLRSKNFATQMIKFIWYSRLGYTFLSAAIKASLIWSIHESINNELMCNFLYRK